ncbi:helix-turn-helix domain-containing protein [Chitinophaga varians]|nr:helix-turn-helix domain-containing protein [Chitinophaga varians]
MKKVIGEVCQLFQVTKPTIYDWIKHGKLKPYSRLTDDYSMLILNL